MTRGRRSLLAVATCLALFAGCGDDEEEASGPDSVTTTIADFKFKPDPIRVKAGGKVTWVNQDKAPHTAQTESDTFDTGRLELGDKKAVEFDEAGKFSYYCIYHRFMTGTVEVVE